MSDADTQWGDSLALSYWDYDLDGWCCTICSTYVEECDCVEPEPEDQA